MYSPESSTSRSTNAIIDRTHQLISNEDIALVLKHLAPDEKELNANIIERIRAYQRRSGLNPDGIVGKLTLNSIKRHSILDQPGNTFTNNNLSTLQAKVPESMK